MSVVDPPLQLIPGQPGVAFSGSGPIASNMPGTENEAFGANAAPAIAAPTQDCTAVGFGALNAIGAAGATASFCTAVGARALNHFTGTAGNGANTAVGYTALAAITTGSFCTAVGAGALKTMVVGSNDTAVGYNSLEFHTGFNCTAVGFQALHNDALGNANTAVGSNALPSLTNGGNNTAVGYQAGLTATPANATVAASNNTFIGYNTGPNTNTDPGNMTLLGAGCLGGAAGVVAIGIDSSGGSPSPTVANTFALGTANHLVQFANNTTGAGSAALGANCPAVTVTAPFTWVRCLAGDGSTVYVPAWK